MTLDIIIIGLGSPGSWSPCNPQSLHKGPKPLPGSRKGELELTFEWNRFSYFSVKLLRIQSEPGTSYPTSESQELKVNQELGRSWDVKLRTPVFLE